ncbi:hypothetical protein N3K63_09740 [Microbacterium sp. W1N]|uniref:hypothetical protein n=1 Tax=Microbacterium festucae TaxID=2977531 RepID=UPI0021BF12FE|nr:hypothetical protein [Microbacterium festucae]MCT9820563.1 hypothetical protein [Microbacterium festucae]
MLTRIFEAHRPEGMTALVSQVVAEVDALVKQAVHPNWTSKDASKKEIRRQLRQLFRRYKLPLTGEPLDSAWAYILRHY